MAGGAIDDAIGRFGRRLAALYSGGAVGPLCRDAVGATGQTGNRHGALDWRHHHRVGHLKIVVGGAGVGDGGARADRRGVPVGEGPGTVRRGQGELVTLGGRRVAAGVEVRVAAVVDLALQLCHVDGKFLPPSALAGGELLWWVATPVDILARVRAVVLHDGLVY